MKKDIYLFSIVLVLLVFAVTYYLIDEPLSKGVAQALNDKPEPISPEQNAYFYLLGLFAPGSESPYRQAGEIIQVAKAVYQSNSGDGALPEFPDGIYAHFIGVSLTKNAEGLCSVIKVNCLDYMKAHVSLIKDIISNNALLVSRLRDVYRINRYQETQYLSGLGRVLKVHNIALADVYIKWMNGDRRVAIDLLKADYEFWRKVMASDTGLLAHMISVAAVERNHELFSRFLSDCISCVEKYIVINDFLRPFSKQELSFRSDMSSELRAVDYILQRALVNANKDTIWSAMGYYLLFKKNTTLNKIYDSHDMMVKLSECDIRDLNKCYPSALQFENRQVDYFSKEFANNPIGFFLATIEEPPYTDYVWVAQKSEIYRRLLVIKLDIIKSKILIANVSEYLKSLPVSVREPITGVEIKWMTKENALGIDFLDKSVMVSL